MTSGENKRGARRDFLLAAMTVTAGLTAAGVAMLRPALQNEPRQFAQAQTTQPDRSDKTDAPADSKPGGTRPTTPSPQPARPDADAQDKGARPALPPAPAEKSAPPINAK